MRGHRTTSGRRVSRAACLGFLIFSLCGPASSRAGGEPDDTASRSRRAAPEIALTADHVRHWEDDGVRYILLEDHAAIFKGDDGIRADRAVVRIVTSPGPKGAPVQKLDIYAEGKAHRTETPKKRVSELRESWTSPGQVDLSASTKGGLVELALAPPGVKILARAFPREPRPEVEAPAAKPEAAKPEEKAKPKADELPPIAAEPSLLDQAVKPVEAAEAGKDEPDERPVRLRDPGYKPVQFVDGRGFPDGPGTRPPTPRPSPPGGPPADDFGPGILPPLGDEPEPAQRPGRGRGTELDPLPGIAPGREAPRPDAPKPPDAPIVPGSQRTTSIYGKSGPNFSFRILPEREDGTIVTVIDGGVNIVTDTLKSGTVDVEADRAIIWRKPKRDGKMQQIGPNGEVVDSDNDPMEVYLEGHVIVRQDRRIIQGKDDQNTYHANHAFYDYRTGRFIGLEAQIDVFSPGLIAPFKTITPRVDAFYPLVPGPNGQMLPSSFQEIRADQTTSTGSRFANPGYRFNSRSIDIKKVLSDNGAKYYGDPEPDPNKSTWRLDARQNIFYMGPVPVFYWPRYVTDVDDLDPPLRQFAFRTNNYFGQQVLLDFNGFKLIGLRKPSFIDLWNVDVDYLSARKAVAVGSEIGWFGTDPIRDLRDPYHKEKNVKPSLLTDYAGYLDMYGLRDRGYDVLGSGPAVITNNIKAGNAGYQRISVPAFQDFRGRFNFRHMQSLNTPDSDPYEDFRFNLEVGFFSDRNFLEQYYKRLFDTGYDHEILFYGIKQKENTALTIHAEANPNVFNTETQWAPKVDYYRLGDSILGDYFTYFQHTGIDWANTHTANEVNNPNLFAFIPYDPVSNTSGSLKTGRAYTSHEVDAPINLGFLRVVPYVQGQAVAWDHQIAGQSVGRIWGAVGARADIMAYKAFPDAENELLNVHGLNHKINFMADYRDAYSNVKLNQIGVQDDLDDNTYEFVRRYFALTNYAGGLLPAQYDPRLLLLRRTASPITGTTDIQATMETLHLGIHQRVQTKRGPEGKRRIIDYLVLDLDTTYFPLATRDNFGKPFGQNTYNFEWYIGDRTSIVSYGWFEFFNIGGDPLFKVIDKNRINPLGMDVITTGININRPPRGNVFIGYSVIDSGPIQTSALNTSYSYWMSPKWFATAGASYDFANQILLGSNASLTRIGKDYYTSVGLNANPLQHSYMFSFEVTPRLSPSVHFGSGGGLTRLDPRYAPVQ